MKYDCQGARGVFQGCNTLQGRSKSIKMELYELDKLENFQIKLSHHNKNIRSFSCLALSRKSTCEGEFQIIQS